MVSAVEKAKETAIGQGAIVPISKRAMPQVIEGVKADEVAELVTRPVLSQERGEVIHVKFISNMVSKPTRKRDKETGEVIMGPNVAVVLERWSGSEMMYVCNAITASELDEKFPGQSYVGHNFAIQKLNPTKGNMYCEVKILRLKDELF